MQAIDLLRQRKSAVKLTDPAPDGRALELMLAAAVHAPDHGKLRPWRFVVIPREARAGFGELLAAQLQRTHAASSPETLARERQKAFRAPLILVVAAHTTPGVKIPVIEQVLSAGAAAHSILLAAVALGFNGVWKTGAPAYDETVRAALGLGADDVIVGFLYLGTEVAAAAQAAPREWRDLVHHWLPPG
ncbi:MAG: nitroreductase family protein [Proteobacteria bacterium]|nr:nitroreductase family protein [Pseudomonadota bacterium]